MASTSTYFRAGLTLGAQSLASLTNFLASAFALSAGSLEEFGRFSIVFQLCQIVVIVGHSALGGAVLVHGSVERDEQQAIRIRQGAASTAIALGLLASALFVVAAIVAPEFRTPLLLAAAGSPAIMAQYTYRALLFARGRAGAVVLVDVLWLLTVLAGGALDLLGWDATPTDYLMVWLLGAAVSGVPVLLLGVGRGRRHIRDFWDVTGVQLLKLTAEALLGRGVYVVSLIATEAIVDSTAAGVLAAAVLIFSPMSVVHTASSAVVVPKEVAASGIHVVRLRVPLLAAAGVGAITLAWGTVLVVVDALGIGVGPFDLEANGITAAVFLWTLLRFLALSGWRGALIGLRIADAAGEALGGRIVGTIAQIVLPVIGLLVAGLDGGVAGIAFGTLIGAGDTWRRFNGLEPVKAHDAGAPSTGPEVDE